MEVLELRTGKCEQRTESDQAGLLLKLNTLRVAEDAETAAKGCLGAESWPADGAILGFPGGAIRVTHTGEDGGEESEMET